MNSEAENSNVDDAIRRCFRPTVTFGAHPRERRTEDRTVRVCVLRPGETEPEDLDGESLPYLAMPADRPAGVTGESRLALVAVEGRDQRMAAALAPLLDPRVVTIGLMHVTWMPRTIASPLDEGGLNNPEPAELLIYQGAREALIDTAGELRAAGFEVSTHLREDRDPARPLAETIQRQQPDLFVLGLGRHGAGIGRKVLETARIPVLFVRAR